MLRDTPDEGDAALVEAVRHGDRRAFELLVVPLIQPAFRVARAMLGDVLRGRQHGRPEVARHGMHEGDPTAVPPLHRLGLEPGDSFLAQPFRSAPERQVV